MEEYITKTQAQELKKKVQRKKHYGLGELHPYVFDYIDNNPKIEDENFRMVSQLGAYVLKKSELSKMICPVCGKEEVVPYFCGASILSGSHVIKAFCHSCKEQIAFNDSSYYHRLLELSRTNEKKKNRSLYYIIKLEIKNSN